jgi:DNA-binding GntR family transcriptional regulator
MIAESQSNLTDKAYQHIRRKLMLGAFAPGLRLSNPTLAHELGVSLMPVRRAIERLTVEGMLESLPRSGTYVREMTIEQIAELYDVREMVEGHAAVRAATHADRTALAQMRRHCNEMTRAADDIAAGRYKIWGEELTGRLADADLNFHLALVGAARNPWLTKMVQDLMSRAIDWHAAPHTPVDRRLVANLRVTVRHHLSIVDALARRDPSAAHRAVIRHVRAGLQNVLLWRKRIAPSAIRLRRPDRA